MANRFSQFATQPVSTNRFSQFAPLAQPKTFDRDEDEALYRQKLAEETEKRSKARVPMSGVEEPATAEEAARLAVQEQRAKEGEQKEFDDSRTLGTRAADTATFLASVPVRMATRGEYGVGDVVEAVSPGMGKQLADRESNFARANETGLEVLGAAGEVMAGVPMLSTMGAPLKGVGATAAAFANKPLPQKAVTRGLVRNERLADIEAFEGSGVTPFGPALTEAGTAGVVKQLSDAPIVGAPVRNRLGQAIEETRDAGERIAGQYGDAKTFRDVGNVVEGGLNRFKDAKAADLGDEAAKALSDDALAATAAKPARETSIKTKQDALYERAWRGIPEEMQKGKSKKDVARFWGGMTNTQNLLKDLAGRNQRMFAETQKGEAVDHTIAYPVRGGIAGRITQDVIEGRWRGNLQSMRDVRSHFRRLASGLGDTEKNTLQLSDYGRMQSAMTQDIISLLERNVEHYAGQKNGAATAAKVRRAIHDFRRADQFTRASVGRLETIEKLYGAQSSEQLALGIVKDAMGGRKGGNFSRLSALRRSLKDEEWGDVSSGVIRELGRPVGSARGAAEEAGFSVNSFMTNWRNMSEEGKNVLFNRPGDQGKALRNSLDRFVRVADKMANFEAMANTSRSATNALGMTGLASIFTAAQQAMTGNFQTAAAAGSVAAGTYAFGKFMSSPLYVRWLTRAAELSGDPGKLKSLRVHARELARLAEKEPDLPLQEMMTAAALALNQAVDAQTQAPATVSPPQLQSPGSH
jgi:hypothetical protein